ncbi:MAG: hypothetical protein AAAB35_17265 [Phyllobacterium sp.]|uniref:hypothetical protein n=1 Tax=Phyllobacterium sp. TaxID=1871046 RepID=UPI0030F11C6E
MSAEKQLTDQDAFELANAIIETQKSRLSREYVEQIGDSDLRVGESWFAWGIYGALTTDPARRRRLIAQYLRRKDQSERDPDELAREIEALSIGENRLFHAVAGAGRQAYLEGGDAHLDKIASIFLNVIKNH